MTKRAPLVQGDWKRPTRLAVLFAAGAIGMMNRWIQMPTWTIALLALSVPAVWFATTFEVSKAGETAVQQRQRMRNVAIGFALAALVILFYVATMARLGGHALNRPI